jgi:TetR/AcrR family transcriptional regulator
MRKQVTQPAPACSAREAIRTAAIKLFAEEGFAATTTREICAQACITRPVLYYHFGSKEQLFYGLMLDAHNEFLKEATRASHRGKTAREKFIEVLAADFALNRCDPDLSMFFVRMVFAAEKGSPALKVVASGQDWLRVLVGIAREGVQQGELQGKPGEIAEALMGIHLLYTMSFLLFGEPKLDRALASRIVDLLIWGCASRVFPSRK